MRVLILGSKEFPMGTNIGEDILPSGGIEVYTDSLVAALNNRNNIRPIIITRKFRNTPEYETSIYEIHRVSWLKGTLFRGPSFNVFSFFKALFLHYDCILAHGPMGGFVSLLLSKIKGCKAIVRPAGIAFTQPQYPMRFFIRRFETFVFSHAHCIIFGSNAEKNRFKYLFGFLPENWKIIPTGIKVINHNNSQSDRIQITYVGRLVKVKGVEYLIKAAIGLKHNFRLLVVGDGPELQSLVELAAGDSRIMFMGFRSNVQDILAQTDIFVLPSLSEGVPLALLEAMASGCACIVTNIGLPIYHGRDGLVVEPKNSSELALAIENLIDNVELRKTLQNGALQYIKENHSLDRMAEIYADQFRRISLSNENS